MANTVEMPKMDGTNPIDPLCVIITLLKCDRFVYLNSVTSYSESKSSLTLDVDKAISHILFT